MTAFAPPQGQDPGSVVERILDDRIDIHSVAEFEALLDVFPDDGDLYRKFADHLLAKKLPEASLVAYNKASRLYLEAGMVLQASVAKILEWSIVKPSHREGRAFHGAVRRKGGGDVPAQLLFAQLTYEEMVGLMRRLVRVRLQPGQTVYDAGEESTEIFFIVAGQLVEGPPSDGGEAPAAGNTLAENDIFGDIFPLEETSTNRCRVTATTPVELVKIAKPVLKAVCYRFPRIRELLERLSRNRKGPEHERAWKTVRRSCRYSLPAGVRLAFSTNGAARPDDALYGTSRDLSTGGICVALEAGLSQDRASSLLDRRATLAIMEDGRPLIDGLAGNVAWLKTVGSPARPTHLVGIAFEAMAEETEMALNAFCTISNDEQDMIWNLWNHLVRH